MSNTTAALTAVTVSLPYLSANYSAPLSASLVAINSQSTVLALQCLPWLNSGTDPSYPCNASMTVTYGPWACTGAAQSDMTGYLDITATELLDKRSSNSMLSRFPATIMDSEHCTVVNASFVPACTILAKITASDGVVQTISSVVANLTLTPRAWAITAGLEKLNLTGTATTSVMSSTQAPSPGSTGSVLASPTATTTGTSSAAIGTSSAAASSTSTGDGARMKTCSVPAMLVLVVFAALLL